MSINKKANVCPFVKQVSITLEFNSIQFPVHMIKTSNKVVLYTTSAAGGLALFIQTVSVRVGRRITLTVMFDHVCLPKQNLCGKCSHLTERNLVLNSHAWSLITSVSGTMTPTLVGFEWKMKAYYQLNDSSDVAGH